MGIKKFQIMLTSKNKKIINTLTDATNNGDLKWLETDSSSVKRDYQRHMYSFGEDGTKYEIEVRFIIVNSKFILESNPSIWVKNKDLPGGSYYIYGSSDLIEDIVSLRNAVIKKYCKDMDPKTEDIESKLEEICKGISISTYRDNKLKSILKRIID